MKKLFLSVLAIIVLAAAVFSPGNAWSCNVCHETVIEAVVPTIPALSNDLKIVNAENTFTNYSTNKMNLIWPAMANIEAPGVVSSSEISGYSFIGGIDTDNNPFHDSISNQEKVVLKYPQSNNSDNLANHFSL